jgi:hypothetical protein
MVQRLPASIAGRRGEPLLLLGLDTVIDLPKREACQRLSAGRTEHLALQSIPGERMAGVMAPLHLGTKLLNRPGHGGHRSPRQAGLACFKPLHRLIILLACGGLIELRRAARHPERPMAHERFHDRQGGPGIEPWGGAGTGVVHAASRAG